MNKQIYKCSNCKTEGNYTLQMERFIEPIFNGPYWPPVGWDDRGSIVTAWCNVCKDELDIDMDDFNRLYVPRKGIVWERNMK